MLAGAARGLLPLPPNEYQQIVLALRCACTCSRACFLGQSSVGRKWCLHLCFEHEIRRIPIMRA